jgi:hypothetical protein
VNEDTEMQDNYDFSKAKRVNKFKQLKERKYKKRKTRHDKGHISAVIFFTALLGFLMYLVLCTY